MAWNPPVPTKQEKGSLQLGKLNGNERISTDFTE
jgi:hypothetical protein